jgi:hypothetical protein
LERVAGLVDSAGADRRRLRNVVGLLCGQSLDSLVRASGLSRRTVEQVLAALGPDLDRSGELLSIRLDRMAAYRQRFGPNDPTPTDQPELVARLAELIAGAPAPEARLDQVAATAETLARRALWLNDRYDLAQARLLCIGDHDLTSLAVCLVNPAARVTVVDIDENLLGYLGRQAPGVRCRYADLRLSLPAAATGWADLVFTDPPYTPEGIELFCLRGLAGLRDREHGRVLVAYGYGDGQPTLGLKVQRAMQGLHLVFEAVLPGFNSYHGAQAVGSASDLYVCRPTPATWRLLERPAAGARIYTHGPQSLEATEPVLEPELANQALASAEAPDRQPVPVGAGWTTATTRVSLARLLARGVSALPPAPGGRTPVPVVNLAGDPGGELLRVLLTTNAPCLVAVLGADHPELSRWEAADGLPAMLAAKYELSVKTTARRGYRLLIATATATGAFLLRWVLDRGHGKLGNVWTEGLIRLAARDGRPLTRNQARAIAAETVGDPDLLDGPLPDLPRHLIADVLHRIAHS